MDRYRELLNAFRDAGIDAVLWKGRDPRSAYAGPRPDGDLDVLIRPGDALAAEGVLEANVFAHVPPAAWRSLPGVRDWYGVDAKRGFLLQVQLYERLILGGAFTRRVELPVVDCLFDKAVAAELPYADDTHAAVLRVCRAAITDAFDTGRSSATLLREARSLVASAAPLRASARELLDERGAGLVVDALARGSLRPLRSHLFERYADDSCQVPGVWTRRSLGLLARTNRRFAGFPVLARRAIARPAPVIVIAGTDRAATSALARRLVDSLDAKFDTCAIRFDPDGESGAASHESSRVPRADASIARAGARRSPLAIVNSRLTVGAGAWRVKLAALNRRSRRLRLRWASTAGFIVVADCHPAALCPELAGGSGTHAPELHGLAVACCTLNARTRHVLGDRASAPPAAAMLLEAHCGVSGAADGSLDALARYRALAGGAGADDAEPRSAAADDPLHSTVCETVRRVLRGIDERYEPER